MPNHFHLVAWPGQDGQLAEFMRLMTGTHSKRWHAFRRTAGTGAVYQSRYKAFPIQTDRHFLTVCRYVERNPQRAGLVKRAEDWPWSSLAERGRFSNIVPLDTWPILQPPDWVNVVNGEEPTGDLDRIRKSLRRGLPMGERSWVLDTANRLGLESATHPRGRPRK
jgi:putative transposase